MSTTSPKSWLVILAISSFVSLVAVADNKKTPSTDDRLDTGGALGMADSLKNRLPDGKLKCVINTYMDVVNPSAYKSAADVGKENQGMLGYFSSLIESNTCLGPAAANFYKDMSEDISADRISLAANAGEGANSSIKPGSIWQKALSKNSQDPEMAMTVLAACAATQKHIDYKITPAQAEAEVRESLKEAQDSLEVIQESIRKISQAKESEGELQLLHQWETGTEQFIAASQSNLRKKDFPLNRTLECPLQIYIPKALGQNVDIPDDLKKKITQAYKEDPSVTIAKMYHVIDSAYIGCRLAMDCNLSPWEAELLGNRDGAAYRAITLCPDIKNRVSQQDAIANVVGRPYEKITLDDLNKGPTLQKLAQQGQVDLVFETIAVAKIKDPTIRQEQFDKLWADLDAAYLYRRWYLGGGQIFGHDIPCTDIRTGGPKDLLQTDVSRPTFNLCGVSGWSKERCAKARAIVAVWDVDFEWTNTEHQVGAKFGAQQCAGFKPKNNLNDRACSYIKASSSSKAVGGTTLNQPGVQ